MRVRLGEVTSGHLQHHYSMVKVVAMALGGEDSSKTKVVNEMSPEAAVDGLNSLFGW